MNNKNLSRNVYSNSIINRYKQQQTPSTSDDASTSTSPKFTIEQKVATNKLGPNNVKRIIDSNKEIVIPRRFGEGIKPIFNREDVQVNSYLQKNRSVSISPPKRNERRKSSSSSCNSSPIRYRPKNKRHEKSLSPKRKKTPDKVPYFLDTKREQDRLKSKIEVMRSKSEHKHTSTETRRRTNRSRSRSRSYERRHRRSSSREKYRSSRRRSRQNRSRSHSRDRDIYYRSRIPVETQYIPVPVPMEFSPFAPRWIHPMIPYSFPRYPPFGNVIRPPPPPHFPIRPSFQPRMRGQRFQRPQRGKYQSRNH